MDSDIKKLNKGDFPQRLFEIPEPPEQLYFKGEMPSWEDTKFVAVVGSRKHTNYGKEACEKIIAGLKGFNVVIVSGLALGIDSVAHQTAIENGLKTLAVPGSGLDSSVLYPSTNKKLAEKIISSGGSLLSEFDPKFKATLYSFPQRNRIMAGLCDVVLVIEAGEKSGTLITARLGTEYNKDVCVVPHSIFSYNAKGSNKLLRQGATPITCSEDLLEALGFQTENFSGQGEMVFDNLSDEEKMVLEILSEPKPKDEIIREAKMPISKINTLISVMEIKGLVKESLGELKRI
ncbi:DNA-processing protein DprA [Patescibacteria group bacterium]